MHQWQPSQASSSAAPSASYPPNASSVFNADDEGLDRDDGEGGAFLLQNAAGAARTDGPGEDAIDSTGKGKGKQREVAQHEDADENGVVPWAHRDIKPACVRASSLALRALTRRVALCADPSLSRFPPCLATSWSPTTARRS